MTKPLFLSMAIAAFAMTATPSVAGDQPVGWVAVPTVVTSKGGPDSVIYRFDTVDFGVEATSTVSLNGPTATVAAPTVSGQTVSANALSQRDSSTLYSRLMAEARERGLK